MLILTRRVGETLVVGDDVTLTVLGVKGNQVRIGVNAPKHIPVHREEIYQRIQREKGNNPAERHTNYADRYGANGDAELSDQHKCCGGKGHHHQHNHPHGDANTTGEVSMQGKSGYEDAAHHYYILNGDELELVDAPPPAAKKGCCGGKGHHHHHQHGGMVGHDDQQHGIAGEPHHHHHLKGGCGKGACGRGRVQNDEDND